MSAAAFLTFETMQKRSRPKQIMQRVFNRFKVQTEFTNKPQPQRNHYSINTKTKVLQIKVHYFSYKWCEEVKMFYLTHIHITVLV
jgi:hypothetical protein